MLSQGGGGRLKTVKLNCALWEGEVKIIGEEKKKEKIKKQLERRKKDGGRKRIKFFVIGQVWNEDKRKRGREKKKKRSKDHEKAIMKRKESCETP